MRISFHQWLLDTYQINITMGFFYEHRPRIFCVDGFNISIQGTIISYSEPRCFVKFYTTMECGFPSAEEDLLKDYAESNDYLDTVYPYTPIEIIEQVIEKHGGIDPLKTFKNNDDLYKHYSRQSKLERILG